MHTLYPRGTVALFCLLLLGTNGQGQTIWNYMEGSAKTEAHIHDLDHLTDGQLLLAATQGDLDDALNDLRLLLLDADGNELDVVDYDPGAGRIVHEVRADHRDGSTVVVSLTTNATGGLAELDFFTVDVANSTLLLTNTGSIALPVTPTRPHLRDVIRAPGTSGDMVVTYRQFSLQPDPYTVIERFDPTGSSVWAQELDVNAVENDLGDNNRLRVHPNENRVLLVEDEWTSLRAVELNLTDGTILQDALSMPFTAHIVHDVTYLPDGTVAVLGHSFNAANTGIYLGYLAADLDWANDLVYQTFDNGYAFGLLYDADADVFQLTRQTFSSADAEVIRVDPTNGAVVSSVAIAPTPYEELRPNAVAVLPDGSFLVGRQPSSDAFDVLPGRVYSFAAAEATSAETVVAVSGTTGHDQFYALAPHPDGYLLAGTRSRRGSTGDTWFKIIDENGETLRNEYTQERGLEEIFALQAVDNDEYILYRQDKLPEEFTTATGILQRIDADLNVLWSTEIPVSGFNNSFNTRMTVRNDGSIALRLRNNQIVIFDVTGAVVENYELSFDFTAGYLTFLPDDGMLYAELANTDPYTLVSRLLSDDGTILQADTLPLALGNPANVVLHGDVRDGQARFFLNDFNAGTGHIYHYNLDGTYDREETYAQFNFDLGNTGLVYYPGGFYDVFNSWLYNDDGTSEFLFDRRYFAALPVGESAFLGVGWRTNQQVGFADAVWQLFGEIDTPTAEVTTTTFPVFPNPNRGTFSFRPDAVLTAGGNFRARILDASGKVRFQTDFRELPANTSYDISADLPAGWYLLQLTGAQGNATSVFVVR